MNFTVGAGTHELAVVVSPAAALVLSEHLPTTTQSSGEEYEFIFYYIMKSISSSIAYVEFELV